MSAEAEALEVTDRHDGVARIERRRLVHLIKQIEDVEALYCLVMLAESVCTPLPQRERCDLVSIFAARLCMLSNKAAQPEPA